MRPDGAHFVAGGVTELNSDLVDVEAVNVIKEGEAGGVLQRRRKQSRHFSRFMTGGPDVGVVALGCCVLRGESRCKTRLYKWSNGTQPPQPPHPRAPQGHFHTSGRKGTNMAGQCLPLSCYVRDSLKRPH